jgi:predicted transcriptional regulator
MKKTDAPTDGNCIWLVSKIVCAYVANNAVSALDVPKLISKVHSALEVIGTHKTPAEMGPQAPAVSIRKSVQPDYLVCLEDGMKFKTLKRHLHSNHDLSPQAYRSKWKLPADYPMVAPNYSNARSSLAKSNGLGRKRGTVVVPKGKRTTVPA